MGILKLKDVEYKYENTTKKVLKNLNIDFNEGKLYCIMGKSGAGKSTLLSLISGLEVCAEGEILFNCENLKKIDRDYYRAQNIGVIFQGYNLINNQTAYENIELSMCISKTKEKNKKEKIKYLLEKVGIDDETANRRVLKLSGGEQQRIGIARALAHNPKVIIADEPTGNLDDETEQNIMKILKDIAINENRCVIVVTHSKEVSKYADEVWGLNGGKLVFIK